MANTQEQILCPACNKNRARKNPFYGIIECEQCSQTKFEVSRSFEFTTSSIRDQRQEYRADILQPWAGNTLSKEYLEEYGTQGIEATNKQIKNAKYTHKGIKGWWNRDKSKGGKHK